MKLEFYWHDMRGGFASEATFKTDIVDAETGNVVGFHMECRTPGASPRRYISLFEGTYQASFARPDECYAYVKGVEQVLNRMLGTTRQESAVEKAA